MLADEMENLAVRFRNADIVAANERVVLTDAFDPDCAANRYPPELGQDVADIRFVHAREDMALGHTRLAGLRAEMRGQRGRDETAMRATEGRGLTG